MIRSISLVSSSDIPPLQDNPILSAPLSESQGISQAKNENITEETTEQRVNRLGRQRPEIFHSIWQEIGFAVSLCFAVGMAEFFISGFLVVLPSITVQLDIPPSGSTWPANAFSLVAGSFLLVFGQLADIYGAYWIYLAGLAWHMIWSIIAGFSVNYLMLDFCRAIQGLGPAAFLPASVMLMGSIYFPGPRKNLIFSLYGASAVLGYFAGIFLGGIAGQFLKWSWYFWFGAILVFISLFTGLLSVPSDRAEKKGNVKTFDWLGSITSTVGLILVVFALTESSKASDGWRTPYIPVTLVLGVLALAAFVYIEGWVAKDPILPGALFKVKGMIPLTIALLFSYGVFGVWLFYTTFYIEELLNISPFLTVAWFVPLALGGIIIATVGGVVLHLLPGTALLAISGIAWILAPLLVALYTPLEDSYWRFFLPAMICGTVGVDVTYNVTNIFITTKLRKEEQGLAGALINSLLFLGNAIFLGLADIIASQVGTGTEGPGTNGTSEQLSGMLTTYRAVLYFAVGLAAVSLIIMLGFVRVGTAKSDLTADEKRELEQEAQMIEIQSRSRGQ